MSLAAKIDKLIQLVDACDTPKAEIPTARAMESSLTLYTAWFCPFAQRVQLALELKQIPYEYIDVDPYNKSKEWLEKNPLGLVPTIFHHQQYIYESTVVLEYLDDAFPEHAPKLFPGNAYQKALNRLAIDHIVKKVIKPFYQILQFQSDRISERQEAISTLFAEISKLVEKMDANGPYFNGDVPAAVDLVFLPWATRMYLLKHYRNVQYEKEFKNKQILERYNKWYHALIAQEFVKATQKSLTISHEQYPKELMGKYQRYADNTAKTLVADAVNKDTAMP